MSESPENMALRTAVPLYAPIWILSIVTGAVFESSSWFGVTLSIPLIYNAYSASRTMRTASEVSIKMKEVVVLNLALLALAMASDRFSTYWQFVGTPINFLLISQLLFHTRNNFNHLFLHFYASLLLLASAVALPFEYYRNFCSIIPMYTVAIYALFLVCLSIYELREKLPILALQIVSLVLAFAFLGSCVVFFARQFPLHPHSSASLTFSPLTPASLASIVLIIFLFYWKNRMRAHPGQDVELNCVMFASAHFMCAFLASILITCMSGNNPDQGVLNALSAYALVFIATFLCLVKYNWRREGPPLEYQKFVLFDNEKIVWANVRTVLAFAAILVAVWVKVFLAFDYCQYSPKFRASTAVALTVFLSVVLTILLDATRAFLLPYNWKLFITSVGLALYAFASGVYVKLHGSLFELKRSVGYDAAREFMSSHVFGVLMVTSIIFVILAIHFGFSIAEQNNKIERKRRYNTAYNAYDAVSSESTGN